MYTPSAVITGLMNVVGWRQNYDPAGVQIPSALLPSTTGRYFQDEHPMVTVQILGAICPDFAGMTAPPRPFGDWVKDKQGSAILKVVDRWLETKVVLGEAQSLFQEVNLFHGTGRIDETVASSGKIVGLALDMKRGIGVKLNLERVGLQFNGTGTFTLYLMHSGKTSAVQSKSITYTGAGTIQWTDLGWALKYDEHEPGGGYYVCYDQAEAPGLAINRMYDFGVKPCQLCDNYYAYNQYNKVATVMPFSVTGTAGQLFDVGALESNPENNFGLNLRLSAGCDLSDWIIRHGTLFASAISKQFAVDILRELLHNPNVRINGKQPLIDKGQIALELDGDPRGRQTGLVVALDRAIDAVIADTRGVDRHCLPCKTHGVRYRSITNG